MSAPAAGGYLARGVRVMIVVMKQGARQEQVAHVIAQIEQGLDDSRLLLLLLEGPVGTQAHLPR